MAGVSPDIVIQPFNHSLENLRRAIVERVFLVKTEGGFDAAPRPLQGHFERTLSGISQQLGKLASYVPPISHQQFVDDYKGNKRVRYQAALDQIRFASGRLEDEARVSAFVKFEKTDRTSKADPVPRVISPRDPRFNIRVGRYLKPLEKRIFDDLGKLFGHTTVMKGMDAYVVARLLHEKWEMFRDPVAVGLDASRFDQHVSLEALRWEHNVYLNYMIDGGKRTKHFDRLKRLLALQEINHCHGEAPDGVVDYTIVGTRMSGDMNTSLGNCILMCSMIKAFSEAHGIRCQLANNGDDCVLFMEKADYSKIIDQVYPWFLKLGFSMTIEPPSYSMEEIEFCQTRPVFDGSRWIMCRNPVTGLTKDSTMLFPWSGSRHYAGWLDAVGSGGMAMTGGLPVFQEFYALYLRSGERRPRARDHLSWTVENWGKGMDREYTVVTAQARASFYWAFGITPDEQICLEKHYASMLLSLDPGDWRPRAVFYS